MKKSKKISCCPRGSKVALIAVATEAVLLWLALDCRGTARDWLWLGRECESRTRLYTFVRICFPSRRSAAPPVVFPSGRGSRAAGESETANYWKKKKTWGLNYSFSVCLPACVSLHLSPSPSLFLSFFPSLQPLSSLTSTTRRSSAALRVCRNTEPEAEVMHKDAVHSKCVIIKTAHTPKDVSMSNSTNMTECCCFFFFLFPARFSAHNFSFYSSPLRELAAVSALGTTLVRKSASNCSSFHFSSFVLSLSPFQFAQTSPQQRYLHTDGMHSLLFLCQIEDGEQVLVSKQRWCHCY